MSDLIYILLTLACFAGLALLVGLIDRRLGSAEATADVNVPHDSRTSGAAR
ncbi:hypothetical protein ACFVDI_26205 [Nocardioides sp. NPDC057767]|uniref:hypothetical protein n=1 Tax=unclassified Nocardioides TaxID=2615069 RepID=UPI00366CC0F0